MLIVFFYIFCRLRHPNIVLVMGVSVVEQEIAPPTSRSNMPIDIEDDFANPKDKVKPKAVKSICIITEYLEQGSLADILYGPNKIAADVWSYELALVCALQAARGMLYLHSHSPPICHRDLKSSNLVVDDHWVVKVTDFGMSRMVPEKLQDIEIGLIADDGTQVEGNQDDSQDRPSLDPSSRPSFDSSMRESTSGFNPMMTSNLGTTAWCAPELLTSSNKTRYSVKVDVYSFGLVLWELWERKRPYEDLYSRFDIIDAIRAGRRPPISASCPPALKSLIQRCWHGQPARRPTFSYIVRYLKDELARIKRQRLASSGTSLGWSSVGGYTPPTFTAGGSVDAPPNSSVLNALHRETVSSSEQGGDSVDTDQGTGTTGWRRFLNSTDDSGPSTEATTPTGGKSWLVRGRQNSSSSPQQPNPSGGNTGTWRDRYVMKFSGWQASRPDTGLPPSVSGGSSSAVGRDRRTSSSAVPIPPPPVRPPAKKEPISSSPSGATLTGPFTSMRNILRTGTGTSPIRRVSLGHHSERSCERELEREREIEATDSRHYSGGVSLQAIEQASNSTQPSSQNSSSDEGENKSSGRSRLRSLSC